MRQPLRSSSLAEKGRDGRGISAGDCFKLVQQLGKTVLCLELSRSNIRNCLAYAMVEAWCFRKGPQRLGCRNPGNVRMPIPMGQRGLRCQIEMIGGTTVSLKAKRKWYDKFQDVWEYSVDMFRICMHVWTWIITVIESSHICLGGSFYAILKVFL